jgi:hypothetical protein
MGNRVNSQVMNVLGWVTAAAILLATVGLVLSWFL